MRTKIIALAASSGASLAAFAGVTLAQQDRYALTVPDGLSFADIKGYETWENVAVSATEGSIKAILRNPAMIAAYREGIPENGKSFPEGVKIVKIEWVKKKNPVSPYFVEIPDTLKTVSFIEKDSCASRTRMAGPMPGSPTIPRPKYSSPTSPAPRAAARATRRWRRGTTSSPPIRSGDGVDICFQRDSGSSLPLQA